MTIEPKRLALVTTNYMKQFMVEFLKFLGDSKDHFTLELENPLHMIHNLCDWSRSQIPSKFTLHYKT